MIAGLIVLAAASAAQLPEPIEQDLRCVAALSLLVTRADQTGKPEAARRFTLMGEYFLGKLDGRAPDLNLVNEARRIARSETYSKEITSDFDRCVAEFRAHQKRLADMTAGLNSRD